MSAKMELDTGRPSVALCACGAHMYQRLWGKDGHAKSETQGHPRSKPVFHFCDTQAAHIPPHSKDRSSEPRERLKVFGTEGACSIRHRFGTGAIRTRSNLLKQWPLGKQFLEHNVSERLP